MKIVILGAGIGGLTVAHELMHRGTRPYDIHIYERNAIIGGMARSGYKERQGVMLPTEYSWRIYGPNYDNLREILKEIPLQDTPDKSVHDNLVDLHDYLIADTDAILKMNNGMKTLFDLRAALKDVSLREKLTVLRKICYCFMISDDHLNALDNMSWKDYIDPGDGLSHNTKKYIVDIMGPYLGAELNQVNVPSVVKTLESFKLWNRPISVMLGPTNEAWFNHWYSHLKAKGVTFHFNSNVVDIATTDKSVTHAVLSDGSMISGDVFYCSLPVESVAAMPTLEMPDIKTLAARAHQLMVAIQFYFDKKITFDNKNTGMYIPDSPWQLVIEPQGSIWNKQYGDIKDIWSIGLCDPVRNGLLIQKPFIHCNEKEIKDEVWYQLTHSSLNTFLKLDEVTVLDYQLWDTYVHNGKQLVTNEPKFSTNKGTYFLRPNNNTQYENFHFATAYTKTDTDMFEMESAAESGRLAARLLEPSISAFKIDRILLFAPYQMLDRLLCKLNLYQRYTFTWLLLGSPLLVLMPFIYIKRRIKAKKKHKIAVTA